jgi:hypothetical protein
MRDTREPLRLRDEGSSALERALLDAGSSYRGSSAARAKTLAALGMAGSATLLAGAAQAAAPSGMLAKLANVTWSKLLAAVSIVGAAAAVPSYYAWQRHQTALHGRATSSVVAVRQVDWPAAAPPVGPASAPSPVTGAAAPVALAMPTAANTADEIPARVSHPGARGGATLAHELSTLDAARGMLARGDAAAALARLDGYARRYPHGRLGLEAEVLRIDALEASGRPDAAHARAEAFLARHPHSVLAARVRAHLAD